MERATDEQKIFLSSLNATLSQQPSKLSDALNIDVAIQKANVCLEKCNKYSFPYHESSAKVVLDNLLLSNTPDEENEFFTQYSKFPSMQDDVKALKLEFWNSLNGKINTTGAAHSKVGTLPLHTTDSLQVNVPDGNGNDEPVNVDRQGVFDGKVDSEKGMENINIKTDSFAEQIKVGSDIKTALKSNNGSIEESPIYSHVSPELNKKLLLDSSGNSEMIRNENVDYTGNNLNSISKDSFSPKENIASEDVENLKCYEDFENENPRSEKKLDEKSFSKVESEKNVISQDISKYLNSFEDESVEKSECTEDSNRTSHRSSANSGTQTSENNDDF